MKKRCYIIGLFIVLVLMTACAQQQVPEVKCGEGYMQDGDGCCKDQNDNSVCDTEEDTLFEPKYAPGTEPIEQPEAAPSYEEPEEPKVIAVPEEKVYAPPKPEVITQKEVDLVMEPELEWFAENEKMSIRITKIVMDVNNIIPRDRLAPDKQAILKEIHMEIKNKRYNYMNFELTFRIQDEKDPLRIKKVLKCNTDDDFVLEGCRQGFREGEVLQIRMVVDEEMQRIDLDKTFRFELENIRDPGSWNTIELSKTANVLEIEGAEYI